jgi:hypothetical protein
MRVQLATGSELTPATESGGCQRSPVARVRIPYAPSRPAWLHALRMVERNMRAMDDGFARPVQSPVHTPRSPPWALPLRPPPSATMPVCHVPVSTSSAHGRARRDDERRARRAAAAPRHRRPAARAGTPQARNPPPDWRAEERERIERERARRSRSSSNPPSRSRSGPRRPSASRRGRRRASTRLKLSRHAAPVGND